METNHSELPLNGLVSGPQWIIEYKVHAFEEGWYGYKIPADPRCRAIQYTGPLTREEANRWLADRCR